jgi:hypothetical protein|tara:strand:- start:2017 stop:2244 length:228 start_codon:yes stop_codon:yes gene_type:complete
MSHSEALVSFIKNETFDVPNNSHFSIDYIKNVILKDIPFVKSFIEDIEHDIRVIGDDMPEHTEQLNKILTEIKAL